MGNDEMGDEKRAFSFITACPLYIQQHLTWSGVCHSIDTIKYYRPSRVPRYRTGRICSWARQASRSDSQDCTLLLNCGDPLPSEVRSSRSLAKFKKNSINIRADASVGIASNINAGLPCFSR